jgi:hypothetical protein
MFADAKAAMMQPCDFARLLGISRITASFWFSGRNRPHHLLTARVQRLLDAVRACMDTGAFPVPRDVSRRERGLYIRKALEGVGWNDNPDS